MPVKHKDQQTISILWISITAVICILLGVVSSYVSIKPEVENLQSQGAQLQSVIQEQNRQIAAMRNAGTGPANGANGLGIYTSAGLPSDVGPIAGQAAGQAAASNQQIQDLTPQVKESVRQTSPATQPPSASPSPKPQTPPADIPEANRQIVPRTSVPAQTPTKPSAPTPTAKPSPKEVSTMAARPDAKPANAPAANGLHPDAAKAIQQREQQEVSEAKASAVALNSQTAAESAKPAVQLAPLGKESDLISVQKPVVKATLAQANIAGMDGASVTFKTGLRVSVGGTFRSGEKLLSVNPVAKRIETDRRVIVLEIEDKVD